MPGWLTFVFVGLIAAAVVFPRAAKAQLTAQKLLAPAVSEFGPQYQDVEKAVAEFRSGKIDEARQFLQSAKKKSPHLAPADVMLAQMMFTAGQIPATRALLEKAVIDHPEDPEPYIILGDLAMRERRMTEAEYMFALGRDLTNKYDENPRRKKSMLNNTYAGLAAVSEARQDWSDAVKRLQNWVASDPSSANAQLRLAQSLFRLKQYDAATTAFAKAHELDQRMARAEINMALLYDQSGDHAEAQKLMLAAAEKGAEELNSRLAVARWALNDGDLELARTNIDAALELEANSLTARLLSGVIARHESDAAGAIEDFRAALALSPDNFAAMNQLALLLVNSDDKEERIKALGYAHLNAQINSDAKQASGRESAVTLTWVLHNLGHDGPALRRLQAILNAGSVSNESAFYVAKMYLAQGQKEAAAKILTGALAQSGAFPLRTDAETLLAELTGKPE